MKCRKARLKHPLNAYQPLSINTICSNIGCFAWTGFPPRPTNPAVHSASAGVSFPAVNPSF